MSVDSSGNVNRQVQTHNDQCYNRKTIVDNGGDDLSLNQQQTYKNTLHENTFLHQQVDNLKKQTDVNREVNDIISIVQYSHDTIYIPFVYEETYLARGNKTDFIDNSYQCTVSLIGKPTGQNLLIYPFGDDECPLKMKSEQVTIEAWIGSDKYAEGYGSIDTEGQGPMCIVASTFTTSDNESKTIYQIPIPVKFIFTLSNE